MVSRVITAHSCLWPNPEPVNMTRASADVVTVMDLKCGDYLGGPNLTQQTLESKELSMPGIREMQQKRRHETS